jgi:hypothetical protein
MHRHKALIGAVAVTAADDVDQASVIHARIAAHVRRKQWPKSCDRSFSKNCCRSIHDPPSLTLVRTFYGTIG